MPNRNGNANIICIAVKSPIFMQSVEYARKRKIAPDKAKITGLLVMVDDFLTLYNFT